MNGIETRGGGVGTRGVREKEGGPLYPRGWQKIQT